MGELNIYNKLMEVINNIFGVCALMASMGAESGMRSNNAQNSSMKKLGMTDEEYTLAVDNNLYTNFATDKIGYGLCQWTSSGRKQGLLNYAKAKGVSIADEDMQIEWVLHELQVAYKSVFNALKNATSIKEASDIVVLKYERPASVGKNASEEKKNSTLEKRAAIGQEIYERMVGMTADKIINMALSYVGTKESPANSNNVIFNTHYYGREVKGSSYPWCMAFVWDIFRMCGASGLFYDGKKTASCTTLMNWAKSKGKFITKGFKPGDVIFYNFDSDAKSEHTGICVSATSTTVTCIEGNTSASGSQDNGGMVMQKTRKLNLVLGAYRPNYEEAEETKDNAYAIFVKGVQKACGAKVDGVASTSLLSRTVTISSVKNNRHAVVKPVQQYLNDIGYPCGKADGIFGSKTRNAVVEYQKTNGCISDGEITAGKKTWKKLLKL